MQASGNTLPLKEAEWPSYWGVLMVRSEPITDSLEGQIMNKCLCVISVMVNCDCSPDWIQRFSKVLIRHVCSFPYTCENMGAGDGLREARPTLRMGDITPTGQSAQAKEEKGKEEMRARIPIYSFLPAHVVQPGAIRSQWHTLSAVTEFLSSYLELR